MTQLERGRMRRHTLSSVAPSSPTRWAVEGPMCERYSDEGGAEQE